ncbi:MAG: hypothetical protein K6E18_01725 [Lachnospiraceae bacterium]|nr:hypothetical protein [Lachnospiraceae bacterium]
MKEQEDYDVLNNEIQEKIVPHVESLIKKAKDNITEKKYVHQNMAPLFGEDSYENQFLYKDAAKLYVLKTARFPYAHNTSEEDPEQEKANRQADDLNYDFTKWEEAFTKDLNQKCGELEKSPYFRRFVRDYCISHNGTILDTQTPFNENEFVEHYQTYHKNIQKASENKFGSLIPETDSTSTISNIQTLMKSKIKDIESGLNSSGKVSPTENVSDAADYIIAKTITGKAAKATFFKGISSTTTMTYNPKTGDNDIPYITYNDNEMHQRAELMKQQILSDPLFQETIAEENQKLTNVYDSYKAKVNSEINKNIKKQNATDQRLTKDKFEFTRYSNYLKEQGNVLDQDTIAYLKRLHDGLEEYNKGKKPSDEMKELMDNLKAVVKDNAKDAVSLYNLNRSALKYYDKRQGIFFSPFTDEGKARLETVGNIIKITGGKMKQIDKQYNKTKEVNQKQNKNDQNNEKQTQKKSVVKM